MNEQEKKPPLKTRPKINQRIIYLIVAVVVIAWVVISQIRSHGENNQNMANESRLQLIESGYKFHNEGELSFELPDGKILSQIQIELADNPQKIALGLMYREKLAENQGMLFIFPDNQPRAFWMKNTILPLDMIFVDSNGIIVTIYEHTTPLSEESYITEIPAKYVVEVNAGYVGAHGIKQGDKIVWTLNAEGKAEENAVSDTSPAQ